MALISITLPGAPRSKKNSPRIWTVGGYPKIVPSKAYCDWFDEMMTYKLAIVNHIQRQGVVLPITGPVRMYAVFYRERNDGDLTNYEAALSDLIQAPRYSKTKRTRWGTPKLSRDGLGLIDDDKQIVTWGESHLSKDADNPRIEFTIDPWQEALPLFAEKEEGKL